MLKGNEVKERLIEVMSHDGRWWKEVSKTEFRTHCEFCDHKNNKMYLLINRESNTQMVYNCFNCSTSGIIDSEFLEIMGVEDNELRESIAAFNKTADKYNRGTFVNNEKSNIIFDYKLPDFKRGVKTQYVENRLGQHLSDEELRKMKIITSFKEFLVLNKIDKLLMPLELAQMTERDYVGFLSYGASHILFRDVTNKNKIPWFKYPITEKSKGCRIFYSMDSQLDIFTKDKITINMAEGVMDIVSCAFNLDNNKPNTINIAVCGKHYISILKELAGIGLIGDNIELNIYADNDEVFNKKAKEATNIKYFNKILFVYKHLYGKVNVFYNILEKDIGVPRERISLKKYKLT